MAERHSRVEDADDDGKEERRKDGEDERGLVAHLGAERADVEEPKLLEERRVIAAGARAAALHLDDARVCGKGARVSVLLWLALLELAGRRDANLLGRLGDGVDALTVAFALVVERLVDADHIDEEVGRVEVDGTVEIELLAKVIDRRDRVAIVHDPAAGKEEQTIEERVDGRSRLMDTDHNRATAVAREARQQLDNVERLEGVEAGGWLVQEDERWIAYDLDAHVGALALAAAHTLVLVVANHRVARLADAELVDEPFDACFLVLERDGDRQPEARRQQQRLVDGQHRVETVVLKNV